MNETHVNRPQMDEAQAEETRADETQAGGNVDVELLRRARLNAMLRELVRQEGRMEAAELLGVNYKTLVRVEESEQVTGRVKDALERLLGTVDDPEDAARQQERVEALEERVAGLEGGMKELRGGLEEMRAAVAGNAKDGRPQSGENGQAEDKAQARDGEHGEGAGWSATKAAPPVAGLRSSRRAKLRRLDPEIVTVEPAEDDVEVYGAAGRPPEPGEEPVVAGRRGAAADAGAGDAGGARANAAPGDPAAAGLRAQGADQLALDGAP